MAHLAALIALGLASAQTSATSLQLLPAPDSAERRGAFRNLVMCVAKARPQWARQTLAFPYLSGAQAGSAAEALSGRDSCVPRDEEADMTFRTSTLVGSLAEHFIQSEKDAAATAQMERALNTAAPLNASEDFALCVAVRNPAAARELALSEPGSASETRSAELLVKQAPSCTIAGENLTLDLQALRALTATALYRAMTPSASASN